ncbi:MAG TPA: hypothetical protein ENF52_07750, partial [Chloroflexi bacterium]|nr:hypothetical protein [Chloroflexota bacterium]
FAQAVGTAVFPTFAAQAARRGWDEMRHTLSVTLQAVFVLCLPATVGLIVLGRPLVSLLFERGAFETSSTEAVTWALAFYALGLIGHAGLEIIARAFYALHDTATPVWVGGVAMGFNTLLSLTLPSVFASLGYPPHAGLALANSIATLMELAALAVLIQRRMGRLENEAMKGTLTKSGIAALGMAGVLFYWQQWLPDVGPLIVGGGGIALGVLVYLGLAWLLRLRPLTWARTIRSD